jgi:hypothetical protein
MMLAIHPSTVASRAGTCVMSPAVLIVSHRLEAEAI